MTVLKTFSVEMIFRRAGELTADKLSREMNEASAWSIKATPRNEGNPDGGYDGEHGGRPLRGSDDEEGRHQDKDAAGLLP